MATDLFEIIATRRTIRRFDPEKKIETAHLVEMVQLGSLAPCRLNKQGWEFIILNDQNENKIIFENILWGIKNPSNKVFADSRYAPCAYIAILIDTNIKPSGFEYEVGACIQNIMIYAWSLRIGSVWLNSINREKLKTMLKIPDNKRLECLIGLGYPEHTSKTICQEGNNYSYFLDEALNLVVPKKELATLIHYNKYGDINE